MTDKWNAHKKTECKAKLSAEEILAEAIKHCEMMIEAKEFVKTLLCCSGVEASKLVESDNAIEEHKDVLRILRGEATTDSIADKKRAYNEMMLDEVSNDKDGE